MFRRMQLNIMPTPPTTPEAQALITELNFTLKLKTGRDGSANFTHEDVETPRSTFLIAYKDKTPLGCGALRPLDETTCEIKRMYARIKRLGIGHKILKALEQKAIGLGYRQVFLETGIQNHETIQFYLTRGYKIRDNYGKYANRPECLCFEKTLVPDPSIFTLLPVTQSSKIG